MTRGVTADSRGRFLGRGPRIDSDDPSEPLVAKAFKDVQRLEVELAGFRQLVQVLGTVVAGEPTLLVSGAAGWVAGAPARDVVVEAEIVVGIASGRHRREMMR